jgi:GGDEF domain-containing protein
MFGGNKSGGGPHHTQQKTVRLPKQMAIPSYGDVQFLMQEAQKMAGRVVELPFSSADKKTDFVLSVRYEPREIDPDQSMDPEWALWQYSGGPGKIMWKHPCRDLSLICNLILQAGGGDALQDVLPSSALMASGDQQANSTGAYNPVATTSGLAPTRMTIPGAPAPQDTASIMFDPPRLGAKATLEGDLNKLQVPNLLQSINLAKMTGRLDIKTKSDGCQVFFQEGIPLHCQVKDNQGDSALAELITWTSGEFRFWPDEKNNDRTVNKRLDAILMEGVTLLDQWKYLETAGLKQESCLVRKNAMMSEQELSARLEKGAPLPLEQQIEFYDMVDNRNTLSDLLRKRPMQKTQWVPLLFNLVSCGLVQITDQAPTQNRLARLKSIGVDENQFQSVIKTLTRSETGIFNYYAFIYFLEQEYLRYEYFNLPFSLIVFSLGIRKGGDESPVVEALQMIAIRRAMQRIGLVKRQIDTLGHYETFDYALLLPNTNAAAAAALANRISDVLREAPLSSDMDSRSLALAFGVATVPEDSVDLDRLIQAAKKARDEAKNGKRRVVLARDCAIPKEPTS